jgi:hypothetical protein
LENNEEEENIKFESDADKKSQAQILAAKQCFLTNIVLGIFFIFSFSSVMMYTRSRHGYYRAIIFNIMKALLPTFTTIANFGRTIQFVILQYWEYFKRSNLFFKFQNYLLMNMSFKRFHIFF